MLLKKFKLKKKNQGLLSYVCIIILYDIRGERELAQSDNKNLLLSR